MAGPSTSATDRTKEGVDLYNRLMTSEVFKIYLSVRKLEESLAGLPEQDQAKRISDFAFSVKAVMQATIDLPAAVKSHLPGHAASGLSGFANRIWSNDFPKMENRKLTASIPHGPDSPPYYTTVSLEGEKPDRLVISHWIKKEDYEVFRKHLGTFKEDIGKPRVPSRDLEQTRITFDRNTGQMTTYQHQPTFYLTSRGDKPLIKTENAPDAAKIIDETAKIFSDTTKFLQTVGKDPETERILQPPALQPFR